MRQHIKLLFQTRTGPDEQEHKRRTKVVRADYCREFLFSLSALDDYIEMDYNIDAKVNHGAVIA